MHPRAERLRDLLRLEPHPEGGFYREVFRSGGQVDPGDGRPGRSALTVIWFLLADGGHSRWHRVASDEVWCFVEGDPLELLRMDAAAAGLAREVLGPVGEDSEPVRVVPAGEWQAARTTGAYTLVSCSVAPGFDFADFAMLAELPDDAARVRGRFPEVSELI